MAKYLDTNGVSHLASKIDERITKRRGIYLVEHGQVTWDGNTFQTDAIMTSADILAYMNYATLAVQISKNDDSVVTLFEFEITDDATQVYFKSALDGNNEYLFAAMDVGGTYAQITGEIRTDIAEKLSDVETMKTSKANIDGSYGQMTVGNAEQLLSTVGITDETPYLFRTSGGSADIGDRENDKIIGGTIVWNQLAPYPFTEVTANGYTAFTEGTPIIAGHKYFVKVSQTGLATNASLSIYCRVPGATYSAFTCSHIENANENYYIREALYSGVSNGTTNNNEGNIKIYINFVQNTSGTVDGVTICDLTTMFGSSIADYLYTLESGTAGAGIAWLKSYGFLTKPYYAYDIGGLQSVKTSAHKTVGFNQMNPQNYIVGSSTNYDIDVGNTLSSGGSSASVSGQNPIIVSSDTNWRGAVFLSQRLVKGNQYQLSLTSNAATTSSKRFSLYVVDKDMVVLRRISNYSGQSSDSISVTYTPDAENTFIALDIESSSHEDISIFDLCLHLVWDGERNGEYEAYVEHTYSLDPDLELHGVPKLDSSNDLYYDGDEYASDGMVTRRYGVVDLGTLTWNKYDVTEGTLFRSNVISDANITTGSDAPNVMCKYVAVSASHRAEMTASCSIANRLDIIDSAYADAATFKSAMSGVYLVYELATQTTESADAYQNPQIVDDWGTEEYIDTRDVQIPVGHSTWYMNNLRAKLEMSPNSPNADGLYLVKHENGINTYVAYIKELPDNPNDNGTYVLKLTKNGSTATLAWVSE